MSKHYEVARDSVEASRHEDVDKRGAEECTKFLKSIKALRRYDSLLLIF